MYFSVYLNVPAPYLLRISLIRWAGFYAFERAKSLSEVTEMKFNAIARATGESLQGALISGGLSDVSVHPL